MKKRPLESGVIKDFRALITALFPRAFLYKNHQTMFSGSGFPDLTAVVEGDVLFLEGKRGNEELSSEQESTLRELTAAGALTGVLRGGRQKKEFLLLPWFSSEDPEETYTMAAHGSMTKEQLINTWRGFVDACRLGAR